MGFIYILLEVDKDGGERHKIGFTKNDPHKRLKQLSTGNSNIISVLKTYQTNNYVLIERHLHQRFKSKRTESNNEWFTLNDEDISLFESYCKKLDENINFLKENNHFFN